MYAFLRWKYSIAVLPEENNPYSVNDEDHSDDSENGKEYVSAMEIQGLLSAQKERIKDQRRFVRVALHPTSAGMFHSDLLGITIMHEPDTTMTPPTNEVIIGTSANPGDFPDLLPGQRILTPVLVFMPHQATFSKSLSASIPLLFKPNPDAKIKIFHSDTDVAEPQNWQEVHDVGWFLHENQVSLTLDHFCLYCVVAENGGAVPEPKSKIVSLFLR